jgi:hypothetical protein
MGYQGRLDPNPLQWLCYSWSPLSNVQICIGLARCFRQNSQFFALYSHVMWSLWESFADTRLPYYAFGSLVVICLVGFVAVRRPDSREPPYIKPGIPLIGHIVGILRYGVPYYEKTS